MAVLHNQDIIPFFINECSLCISMLGDYTLPQCCVFTLHFIAVPLAHGLGHINKGEVEVFD